MDKSIHSHLYHQVIGRLRGKREKLGITQIQLAELLKVNQTFVSRIETCDRRLYLIELRQICQVLGRLCCRSRKGYTEQGRKVND
jgi:predicted transcriptional regulator